MSSEAEADYPKTLDPEYQDLWDAAVRCLLENGMKNSAPASLGKYDIAEAALRAAKGIRK